jgi:predicted negative regulator of RcsB-dependent stress response
VSTYQTEEEQVEALKKWWQENGKSVIAGVVIGLLVVAGGKGWIEYNRIQSENASAFYEGFSTAAASGDLDKALKRGEALIREYGGSTYATFTALELARLQYEAGEKDKARERLQWVLDNAPDEALGKLAKVRLARLLLDAGALDQADRLSAEPAEDAWQGEFLAIQGDIKLARGDREGARKAYSAALKKGVSTPALVRMKLVELGG